MITKERLITLIQESYDSKESIERLSERHYESEDEDILSYNLEMLLDDLWSEVNLDLIRYRTESDMIDMLTTYIHLTDTKKYSVILNGDLRIPTTLNEVIDMILYYQEEIEEIERA